MRTLTLALFVAALQCVQTFAQLSPAVNRAADRDDILKAIEDVSRAYVARDPAPIERTYLDNYVSIRGKPVYNSREQLLVMMRADALVLKAGKKLDYDTISYESENPRFNFYGRAAILNLAKKNYWQYRGLKCMTRYQATELWVKPEGDWKIAASHSTTFQCDPKPFHPIHPAVAAIPSRTKAPPNNDAQAELQLREIINSIAGARSETDKLGGAARLHTSSNFIATNTQGEVIKDRTILETMPALTGGRGPGRRITDDALVIFGEAAIYTYKLRSMSTAANGEASQQVTVFFAKQDGRWMIAAAHFSKYSTE